MIDHLIFMGQGEVIYQGGAEEVVPYFAKLGFVCPKYTNPSDFLFMNVANDASTALTVSTAAPPRTTDDLENGDSPTKDQKPEKDKVLEGLLSAWKESEDFKNILRLMELERERKDTVATAPAKSPWLRQFSLLAVRAWRNATRSKLLFIARLFQTLFVGFVVAVLFWNVNDKNFASQLQVSWQRTGGL
jgi:ATP-binding cassette subfamily G (WHITE) protein 1